MATLVLTAVGTAIGGPLGGALGALAGQALDSRLLGGKGRSGPRLTELAVQTSSYGTPIPQLFGTMRVAGTVIWSTDLIEHANRSGGGKGASGGTSYSYSASFAVLLSARAIRSVRRIWADGKLLRGAAGDFKTGVKFRLYLGDGDQQPDPLIASAVGVGKAPGCRGQAYAVFEDLALGDFGNRIPSLTFEVEADAGAVDCGAILAEVSGGMLSGNTGTVLLGYSAYGDTLRGVADGLRAASGAWVVGDGDRLLLRAGVGDTVAVADPGAGPGERRARSMAAADVAPRVVTIQHHDPARDYQSGLQSARRTGAGGREHRIELPAAIDAASAKRMAAAALARADTARERRTVSLDWRSAALAPGDRVRIAGEAGDWRVATATLDAMVLTLELVRIVRAPPVRAATSGVVLGAPDEVTGGTVIRAFELPATDDTILSAPRVTILANGTGAGWRAAMLHVSVDGGRSWSEVGPTRGRATLGVVAVAPGAGPSTLVDEVNTVEVDLTHPGLTLFDADDAALDRGANLAIVGDELLQFGVARRIGPLRWRLGRLWRGRRATEWASGRAVAGDSFALIDPATTVTIDLSAAMIGGAVRVMAIGVGDGDASALADVRIDGRSVAPPSPVHVRRRFRDDGGFGLHWVRRSRAGWHWVDRVDAALVEEAERYAVASPGGGDVAIVSAPQVDDATLGGVAPETVEIRQVGTVARSRASRWSAL